MPLSKLSKTIALVILASTSANTASAQAVIELLPPAVFDRQNPAVDLSHTANIINATPRYTLPGHVQLPNHQGNATARPNNSHGAQALGALIGLGVVAGAVHAANQPRTRIQCPTGTEPRATPIGSGPGGVVHNGYRWICVY